MSDINRVLLYGRVLGQDSIRRFAIRNGQGLSFMLSTVPRPGPDSDAPGGAHYSEGVTVPVVAYDAPPGRMASTLAPLIKSGTRLFVEGRLCHRRCYQKSGPLTITEVEATQIESFGGRDGAGNDVSARDGRSG